MKKFIIVCYSLFMTFVPVLAQYSDEYSASNIYKQNVDSMLYVETQDGSGSGVIVRPDGTFVTCFHVIANADYIKVKMNDGSIFGVNGFKYINPTADIAVLTLDTTRQFTPIKIAPKNSLKVGEKVYTISNPQGLKFVFSDGMINQFSEENIQFSAPVSPGSSGGALLNSNGELLGIITSQYNLSSAQNMNFALPNNFYSSSINNTSIINKTGLKWTDFLVTNADQEQFTLYLKYVFNDETSRNTIYKYLKPFTIRNDIPITGYIFLGRLALQIWFFEEKEEVYIDDAIKWYEATLTDKKFEEETLISLQFLYSVKLFKYYEVSKPDSIFFEKFEDVSKQLSYKYPNTQDRMLDICDKVKNCGIDVPCIGQAFLEQLTLLAEIYKKNKIY